MGTLDECPPRPVTVRVGVDIGQKLDPTAIVVVEIQRRDYTLSSAGFPSGGTIHFVARSIGRLPLGATYPAITRRLVEIADKIRARGLWVDFWIDATGVGQPVVDCLKSAGLSIRPVYLTGSDQVTKGENDEMRMGKAAMVSRLQVLLQSERIHLPQTPESSVLIQELLDYEIRVNDHANTQFGAFKVGSHDDLATALGLACWEERYATGESAIIPPHWATEDIDRAEIEEYRRFDRSQRGRVW